MWGIDEGAKVGKYGKRTPPHPAPVFNTSAIRAVDVGFTNLCFVGF